MTTSVVLDEISVDSPPITPAIEIGPESSATTRSSGDSFRSEPSRVRSVSPSVARRTMIVPSSLAASKACSGWPYSSIT